MEQKHIPGHKLEPFAPNRSSYFLFRKYKLELDLRIELDASKRNGLGDGGLLPRQEEQTICRRQNKRPEAKKPCSNLVRIYKSGFLLRENAPSDQKLRREWVLPGFASDIEGKNSNLWNRQCARVRSSVHLFFGYTGYQGCKALHVHFATRPAGIRAVPFRRQDPKKRFIVACNNAAKEWQNGPQNFYARRQIYESFTFVYATE